MRSRGCERWGREASAEQARQAGKGGGQLTSCGAASM